MSGICGIVNFDGTPVDSVELRKMAETSAYLGPDGIADWVGVSVGMAHLALHTTPESVREFQPVIHENPFLILVSDARVDNREELIGILVAKRFLQETDPTDADLILAAYACWGEICVRHIIGDFAFAIWDKNKQELFCARDHLGIRPFFYCQKGSSFYFATSISSINHILGTPASINERVAIDFLHWRFTRWKNETIYEGIFRLPGACSMRVTQDKKIITQYWELGEQPGIIYRSRNDYLEHFTELFEGAVQCRLRCTTPVGISVSGGLDSSSIACLIHHLASSQGNFDFSSIKLFSQVFDDRYPRANEQEFLDAVLEKCHGFPSIKLAGEKFWGFQELGAENDMHLDEPEIFPFRTLLTEILNEARQNCCRVLLTGEGGDQILSSSAYWSTELLFDMNWEIPSEWQYFWERNGCRLFYQLAKLSLVKLLPKSRNRFSSQSVRKLSSRTAAKVSLQLQSGWYSSLLGYLNSLGYNYHIEYRFPYLDLNLIEFILRLPADLKFQTGFTKVILRESMVNILPEKVRQRTTNAIYNEVVSFGVLEKEVSRVNDLYKNVIINLSQYMDVNKFTKEWELFSQGRMSYRRSLLAPFLFEVWYRSYRNLLEP